MGAAGDRFKLTAYNYDLISGKVNQVNYQPHSADAFYHQYSYDAENRITRVRTSTDSIEWQNDASYTYYRHGPLARVQLGDLQ
jgi:YD repeat-containing protein